LRDSVLTALQSGPSQTAAFEFRIEHWRDPTALFPSAVANDGAHSERLPPLLQRLRHPSLLGIVAAVVGYRAPTVEAPTAWAHALCYQGIMSRPHGDRFGGTFRSEETAYSEALTTSTKLGPKDLLSLVEPSWILAGWELTEEEPASGTSRGVSFIRAEATGSFQALPPLISRASSLRIRFDENLRIITEREAFAKGKLLDRLTVVSLESVSWS
jgi:hypothetical protein